MSRQTELKERALYYISAEFDISADDILSKKREADVVDARYTLINILYSNGVYPSRIAAMLNMTTRMVNYAVSNFHYRLKSNRLLRNNYETIVRKLSNPKEINTL